MRRLPYRPVELTPTPEWVVRAAAERQAERVVEYRLFDALPLEARDPLNFTSTYDAFTYTRQFRFYRQLHPSMPDDIIHELCINDLMEKIDPATIF